MTRHLLKPMSQRMKQVFAGWALEAVLAAALRPPSNEDSLADGSSLGGLRRSFVTRPAWSFIGVSPETSIGRIVWLLLSTEAPIYGLDKPVGRPRTRRGTVQAVVVHGRPGRLHLLQRHAASNHVLNTVANDRDHVPVVGDVANVAKPSMTGDHHRAALRPELGNREVQNEIQSIDNSLNAAAPLQVDHGIAGGR